MFYKAITFNCDLSGCNTVDVEDEGHMPHGASAFTGVVSGWDMEIVVHETFYFQKKRVKRDRVIYYYL